MATQVKWKTIRQNTIHKLLMRIASSEKAKYEKEREKAFAP